MPGVIGAEVKRRLHVVGNVKVANFFVTSQVLIKPVQHCLLVIFAEAEAAESERVFQHGKGNPAARRSVGCLRPQDAGEKRGAETGGRKIS